MIYDILGNLVLGLVIFVTNYIIALEVLPKWRYKTMLKKWYECDESNEQFIKKKWVFKNLTIAILFPYQFISNKNLKDYEINFELRVTEFQDVDSLLNKIGFVDKLFMFFFSISLLTISTVAMISCMVLMKSIDFTLKLLSLIPIGVGKNITKEEIRQAVLKEKSDPLFLATGIESVDAGDWTESNLKAITYVSVTEQVDDKNLN